MSGFPVIDLSGQGSALGEAMGEALRDRIAALWQVYVRLFAAEPAALQAWAGEHEAAIRRCAPVLAEEIAGIARGAGQPEWRIFALNARTEILRRQDARPECTSLWLAGPRLLAQTWDWARELEDLSVVLRIARPGGTLITFTEPGILGKIGLNSAGVGVCLNILKCQARFGGVPIHVLLRMALECDSADAARARIAAAEKGTASHILVADASGAAHSLEIAGDRLFDGPAGQDFLVHSNHYLWSSEPGDATDLPDSQARLDAAAGLIAAAPARDAALARAVLSLTAAGDGAICCPYQADDWLGDVGTVASLILDLPARALRLRRGPDPAGEWRDLIC